jgi:hypothetical protein
VKALVSYTPDGTITSIALGDGLLGTTDDGVVLQLPDDFPDLAGPGAEREVARAVAELVVNPGTAQLERRRPTGWATSQRTPPPPHRRGTAMTPTEQNLKNKDAKFNIHLNQFNDLEFRAHDFDGRGDILMKLSDVANQLSIGGSGRSGAVQLRNPTGENTIFIGSNDDDEAAATIGGGGQDGRVTVKDHLHRANLELRGRDGAAVLGGEGVAGSVQIRNDGGFLAVSANGVNRELSMFDASNNIRVHLTADQGRLQLKNGTGTVTADLWGDFGVLTLGGADQYGTIVVKDAQNTNTIICSGSTGDIDCGCLTESCSPFRSAGTAPLEHALDGVLALRGVRYPRRRAVVADPGTVTMRDGHQVGFVGEELEEVFPDLVTTDAEGHKSASYSRMAVVLVEAIKEQQHLIRKQAAALRDAEDRIAALEADVRANA